MIFPALFALYGLCLFIVVVITVRIIEYYEAKQAKKKKNVSGGDPKLKL